MKELIVMCASSNSGKSTYAHNKYPSYTIINSDTIRWEISGKSELGELEECVWKIFQYRKLQAIKRNENIVLDACHITSQARWYALEDVPDNYKKICIRFDTSLKTIMGRNIESWTIDMWKDFNINKPTKQDLLYEGFDEVIIVKE